MKKRLWFFLTMTIVCSFIISSCNSSSTSVLGNWTKRSDFDGLARCGASQFTIGSLAFVGLGLKDDNSTRLKDFWQYDNTSDAWTQVASLPDAAAARNSAVAFAIGTKGYIGTGLDKDALYLKDFWEYNSVTNVWAQKADFGGTARYGAVAFSIGKNGYIGTGYDGNYLKDFWKYDTTANTWSQIASIGGTKRRSAASFVINGVAYVCTGVNNGSYVEDFWKFDGTSWTELRKISNTSSGSYDDDYAIIRSQAVGFASSTHGYIALGYNSSILKTVWEYDYINDLWSQKTSFEGTERYNAVSFSIGDRLYVTTGENGSTSVFDDLWEFKPSEAYDEYN